MPVKVYSVAADGETNARRIIAANQVIDHMCSSLPQLRLVVLLDGQDWYKLKEHGEENRGAFYPVRNETYSDTDWPTNLREYLVSVDDTGKPSLACEGAVYLHNSTCETPASLTMTLAHELQHATQYATNRTVWAYNGVVTRLPPEWIARLGLQWKDIPIECEARIVAKRVCEELLGAETTNAYIEERITKSTLDRDREDWKFVQSIVTSKEYGYNVTSETGELFRRIDPVFAQLDSTLAGLRKNPDFSDLHLDQAFRLA